MYSVEQLAEEHEIFGDSEEAEEVSNRVAHVIRWRCGVQVGKVWIPNGTSYDSVRQRLSSVLCISPGRLTLVVRGREVDLEQITPRCLKHTVHVVADLIDENTPSEGHNQVQRRHVVAHFPTLNQVQPSEGDSTAEGHNQVQQMHVVAHFPTLNQVHPSRRPLRIASSVSPQRGFLDAPLPIGTRDSSRSPPRRRRLRISSSVSPRRSSSFLVAWRCGQLDGQMSVEPGTTYQDLVGRIAAELHVGADSVRLLTSGSRRIHEVVDKRLIHVVLELRGGGQNAEEPLSGASAMAAACLQAAGVASSSSGVAGTAGGPPAPGMEVDGGSPKRKFAGAEGDDDEASRRMRAGMARG